MKASELRYGNYVTIDNKKHWPERSGKTLIVLGLSERNEELFPNSEFVVQLGLGLDSFGQFEEFIKPITLTEEWLLKFGFDKVSDIQVECFFIQGELKDFTLHIFDGLYVWIAYDLDVKYVHQLQNLYFALTGEELTLKNRIV